jgi:ribosomal protein L23
MNIKPVATEKAIMKVELDNVLTFSIDQKINKAELKLKK